MTQSTDEKQFDALDEILFALDNLDIAQKDIVLEAARLVGYERNGTRYPVKAGPTTDPDARRMIERWRHAR